MCSPSLLQGKDKNIGGFQFDSVHGKFYSVEVVRLEKTQKRKEMRTN
jgi:hypothetical protein